MDPFVETTLRILFGAIVLFAGRSLFWLFVGLVGFLLGADLAQAWLANGPAWLLLIVALGAGLVGAVIAIVFQRIAVAVAGFYAAAYISVAIAIELGYSPVPVVVPVAAGLLGALIAALLMDWAIIVLSALAGAAAIAFAVTPSPTLQVAALVILASLGILVQRGWQTRRYAPAPHPLRSRQS